MYLKNKLGLFLALSIIVSLKGTAFGQTDVKDPDINIEQSTNKEETIEEPSAFVVIAGLDASLFPQMSLDIPDTEEIPRIFEYGTQNFFVASIQQRLMSLGYMEDDEPTETYGSATELAVKVFQRCNKEELQKLSPDSQNVEDGRLGKNTLKLLFSPLAKPYTAKLNDKGEDIKLLNQRLYTLGYLARQSYANNDIFDAHTDEALRSFQQNNDLSVDGTFGINTHRKLFSEDVKARTLVKGEQSENVLVMQELLQSLGYLTTKPDGIYGNDTVIAVKRFQKVNGCSKVDGTLGPETRETLLNGNPRPFAFTKGDGTSNDDEDLREQIKRIQRRCIELKYLAPNKDDGIFGDSTEQAIKEFQRANGLTVDGAVGTNTLAKLNSPNAKKFQPRSNHTSNKQHKGHNKGHSDAGSMPAAPSYNDSASSNNGSVETFINVAKSKLGSPYVWGSKGPNSFDCSGFVYWCLNNSGVRQSYLTSYGWRSNGRYTRISNYSDIRRGDIIVVRGHVGIALGGGGVIDASSSNGRVVQRSLSDWWRRNFKVAWRIFN